MEIRHKDVICDWIQVRGTHGKRVPEVNDGFKTFFDSAGNTVKTSAIPLTVYSETGRGAKIKVDGDILTASGNFGAFAKFANIGSARFEQALANLDHTLVQAKTEPTKGGMKPTRIDMAVDIETGETDNVRHYLDAIAERQFAKLEKTIEPNTVYFGKRSTHKTIKAYDKGKHLLGLAKQEKDSEKKKQLMLAAQYCLDNGIVRIEISYKRSLQRLVPKGESRKVRLTDLTHEKLAALLEKDVTFMGTTINKKQLDKIPTKYLATLAMYLIGESPKKRLHRSTYQEHRKALLKYGYDIGNENIEFIKPKTKTIVLKVAQYPDCFNTPDLRLITNE